MGIMTGVVMLVIGFLDPKSTSLLVGLVTGLAFFEEAGNGGCYALVPHVHPTNNGELAIQSLHSLLTRSHFLPFLLSVMH